jgi:hypothetical protein
VDGAADLVAEVVEAAVAGDSAVLVVEALAVAEPAAVGDNAVRIVISGFWSPMDSTGVPTSDPRESAGADNLGLSLSNLCGSEVF